MSTKLLHNSIDGYQNKKEFPSLTLLTGEARYSPPDGQSSSGATSSGFRLLVDLSRRLQLPRGGPPRHSRTRGEYFDNMYVREHVTH
jgi:hypothetical protein